MGNTEVAPRQRRKPPNLWMWAGVGILLLAFLGLLGYGIVTREPSTGSSGAPRPGKAAPDFELATLPSQKKGGKRKRASLRGRVVLLDFFASWCEPCRQSLPFYAELQRRYDSRLTVVAVSLDEREEDLRRFVDEMRLDVRILHDPSGRSAERLNVRAMPTLFLIDRHGLVRARHESFRPADREAIERKVRELCRDGP